VSIFWTNRESHALVFFNFLEHKMATASEFIEFLKQYPEDAIIQVLHEVQSAWSISTEIVDLDIAAVEVLDNRKYTHIPDDDILKNQVLIRLL